MISCKEHPVKAFSLTLTSAGKDVAVWCLPYILHFINGDIWASRFNDIGSDNNNFIKTMKKDHILLLQLFFAFLPLTLLLLLLNYSCSKK
jgi:hypothetical protein